MCCLEREAVIVDAAYRSDKGSFVGLLTGALRDLFSAPLLAPDADL